MCKIVYFFLLLTTAALCNASNRGIVSGVENCGSAGTLVSVEATDCDLVPCNLSPGNTYAINVKFIPSATTSELSYKVTAVIDGQEIGLVDLPALGDVQEGNLYELTHDLPVSNELVPGMTITVRFEIWDNTTGFRQICASAQANIV